MDRLSQSAPATVSPAGWQTCGETGRNPGPPGGPHFDVDSVAARGDAAAAASRPTLAIPPTRLRWLRDVAVVFAWEIRTFLLRPTSYVLLLAAAALAGWSFSWLVTLLARGSDPALRPADDPISQFLGPNVFLIGACTLFVPLLTMNAIAEERRRGSWELLLTAHVSRLAVVLGKFAALWCLFMICVAPWLYHLVVLRCWNGRVKFLWNFVPWSDGAGLGFDWGIACGGGIGIAVVGGTFVAIGLFCSGLCRGAATAALLALVAMTGIVVLGFAPRVLEHWNFSPDQVRMLDAVSCWGHIERFSHGILEPRIIAGHLSICAALLWGTACVARRVDEG